MNEEIIQFSVSLTLVETLILMGFWMLASFLGGFIGAFVREVLSER